MPAEEDASVEDALDDVEPLAELEAFEDEELELDDVPSSTSDPLSQAKRKTNTGTRARAGEAISPS